MPSDLEAAFVTRWRQLAPDAPEPEREYRFAPPRRWRFDFAWPEPEREYRFAPPRRWRFDFAWPDAMVAVECEGGTWSRGRHVRGGGFERDCAKYNAAALAGWTVVRLTRGMLETDPARWVCTIAGAIGGDDAT